MTRCDQGDPLGIVQEIEIWPYEQIEYAIQQCWHTNGSPDPGQKTRPCDI